MQRWWMQHALHHDSSWIHLLARSESALLASFEQAIGSGSRELARVLQRQLPRLNCNHLDMHSLTKAARL